MKVLIAITILCFAFVNCETKEEILERTKNECDDTFFGGRYVDPFNCQGYYRCVSGELVKKDCAVGLGYDPKSQECKPKVEGCSITGTPKEIKETNEEFVERMTEQCYDFRDQPLSFVDPVQSHWYYRCSNGRLDHFDCSEEKQYDPKIKKCVKIVKEHETKEEVLKRITKECDSTLLGGGRFVDPFNCQGYYRCVSAKLVKKNCAVGLGFDSKSQQCKPKVEGCKITGTPKEIKETKEQILQRITEECYDLRDYSKRFIDPFHSNRYYRCNNGDGVLSSMECLGQYDPKLEKCT